MGCLQGGDLDIGYLSELDPMWDSSSLSMIIQPEAILFGNIIAQGACAADAVASLVSKPIDALFWCAGSQGSMYRLTAMFLTNSVRYRRHCYSVSAWRSSFTARA
nr:hypothetical protein pSH12sh288-5_00004 [Shigella sonnei]